MKKPRSLTTKELVQIGKVDGQCYKFDLSRLSGEKFDNLLKSLSTMTINRMTGLGFNIDLLTKTKQRRKNTEKNGSRGEKLAQKKLHQMPVALSSSVMSKKKNATRSICLLLSETLPKSETLEFLKFRSLPLKMTDIELLSQGIFESNSLRTLRFCDVPLKDEGFERLARAMRRQSILNLQLRKCSLTDASGNAMRSLLYYHSYIQNEAEWRNSLSTKHSGSAQCPILCLTNLDLRDNEFTFEYIDIISDPLIDLRIIKVLDLRGNAGITNTVISKLVTDIPDTAILTGPSKPIKSPKPPPKIFRSISQMSRAKSTTNDIPRMVPSGEAKTKMDMRIHDLEVENERLSLLIEYLQNGTKVIELEPGLKIIGPRADIFAEHIVKLDELLSKSQDAPQPFLSSSSVENQ
ncbi:hypothetical protein M9Y10_023171 [Tritrichomonas musculus]|uniref:Leucine Rich Repeat family protein n=1 Tax=Tritrichomonas musculus TaxID=1915356 RepID=A0ABR2KUF9_9EUKA